MRILVVEDEPQLARHIASALARHGHQAEVHHDGSNGLKAAVAAAPDLLVLDLTLPGLDGLSLLGKLRESNVLSRVLILTARGEVQDRIKGLRAGADDYLAKPFSTEELVARVDALGRRTVRSEPRAVLTVADLQLDVVQRRAVRGTQALSLSPREFDLLHVLMQEPGRVFSRAELCERVWQRDHAYDTRTVEIFITRLRKKVDAGFTEALIHTVRTVGYAVRAPEPS